MVKRDFRERLNMTLSSELKEELEQIANKKDMSVSALCREIFKKAVYEYGGKDCR